MNWRTDSGTSPNSTQRRRNSSATSTVASRDHPSAVLKATMRTGFLYSPDSRLRISVSRSVASPSVSRQECPIRPPRSSSTRYVSCSEKWGAIDGDLRITELRDTTGEWHHRSPATLDRPERRSRSKVRRYGRARPSPDHNGRQRQAAGEEMVPMTEHQHRTAPAGDRGRQPP